MTPTHKALEAAAMAAEEAMMSISVCEDADGMSYALADAIAEARGESDLSGARDVLRDAAEEIARAAITAYLEAMLYRSGVAHVARAICVAVEIGPHADPDKLVKDDDHGSTYHPIWEEHIDAARAALAALKPESESQPPEQRE